jgi:hypothetical protein
MAAPGTQRSSAGEDIMDISGQEELGESSKALRVEDFELVKTLGTGRLGALLSLILSDALHRMDGEMLQKSVEESC